jgi:alpha-1,6-mannosyltransferase
MNRPLRIVRLANFVTASSGGLRTALRELGQGYAAAGHEPVLVIPGNRHSDELTPQGRVITLPGPRVPGLGGYRLLTGRRAVAQVLAGLKPDRLEISDRTTLRWTGDWARANGVRSVMVSHESLDGLLRVAPLPPALRRRLATGLNRATAASYDRVLCTTDWAAREFHQAGATNVRQVPLGVDLGFFHPRRRSDDVRSSYGGDVLLLCCTRLSVEKRPERAVTTLKTLLARGIAARLVLAGDGPLRPRLTRLARGLPVTFTGWIDGLATLAALQASADIVLAPGPIETFGLAALEALASGTPVVASASSALPGVIGPAGAAVAGEDLAAGVLELLAQPEPVRRARARARAELFGWAQAVQGFLDVHEAPSITRPARHPEGAGKP